jgi:putative transposase
MNPVKRTGHAAYDLQCHIVWIPKYRKLVLEGRIAERLKEICQEIVERYEVEIDTMEALEYHVHLFLSAPPCYAPAEVVQIMKSISAKLVSRIVISYTHLSVKLSLRA